MTHHTSWQIFADEVKYRLLGHIASLDLENPPILSDISSVLYDFSSLGNFLSARMVGGRVVSYGDCYTYK